MSSLILLEDAAQILGMSPEELSEARSRGEVHAYRDGKTWKFKKQELDRYKSVLADATEALGASDSVVRTGSSAIIDADLDELVDLGESSALTLDDDVIDDSNIGVVSSSSSTIIGKAKLADEIPLSDISLEPHGPTDSPSDLTLDAGSDVPLEAASAAQQGVSEFDVALGDSGELNLQESSIKLSAGSDIFAGDAESGDVEAATGELGKAAAAMDDDELIVDYERPELHLSDEDLELSLGSSSEISLDAEDLDLAASDTGVGVTDGGSDVTLDASDSGINLSSPADSGIALDHTPPELDMSGDEVLELGEAELVDLDDAVIEDESLQGDDDFLLSPSESDMGEEDSGSQVIALDTEELDDDAATLVRGTDSDEIEPYGPDDQAGIAPLAGVGGAGGEAAYSILNVLSLGLVLLPLGLTGLFMFDLVRNMWSWNGAYPLNSTIMDFILQMFS